ncbi:MAG: hypothetical protein IPJ60_18430 [Sphingobacteriaceae bacterium]|nr:hypothetical protein [Sphingobacteriaceae bacterium]
METKPMSKTRKITTWILVGLMSALFIMSATMKLTAGADAEIAKNLLNGVWTVNLC